MFGTDNKRQVWSWAMYDFANSAFTTIVVSFIYGTYFTKSIAPNEILGTQWWSWAVSLTAIVVAFLSPFLGALSDLGTYRKRIMWYSTLSCVIATAILFCLSTDIQNEFGMNILLGESNPEYSA